jgi:hypothetical protein
VPKWARVPFLCLVPLGVRDRDAIGYVTAKRFPASWLMIEEPEDADIAEERSYLLELGSFIENYAIFETALLIFLESVADIDQGLISVFCSGSNVDQKMKYVRRIWSLRPPHADMQKEVFEVFEHAQQITTMRNFMLHYGSFVTPEGERITTDYSRALIKADAKRHRVSPAILVQMRLDILKCANHLLSLSHMEFRPLKDRESSITPIRRTWQFTPPAGARKGS